MGSARSELIQILKALLLVVAFIFLAGVYLQPASLFVLGGDRNLILSDGIDSVTAPSQARALKEAATHSPLQLLNGTILNLHLHPPEGFPTHLGWLERALTLISFLFVPIEQAHAFMAWALLAINGICFYWMGRELGWSRSLSFSLAFAFAFSPFTRARASTHPILVGIYLLPLTVVALNQVFSLKRRLLPSALILAAAAAAHYHVLMLALLTPLFILTVPRKTLTLSNFRRLSVAALPAFFLLIWTFASQPGSGSGFTSYGDHKSLDNFVYQQMGTKPIDYLTSDMTHGPEDWIPLRELFNRQVLANLGNSDAHERANGIRWSVLILFFIGLLFVLRGNAGGLRSFQKENSRRMFLAFTAIAAGGFLCSLPPPWLEAGSLSLAPSELLRLVVPSFRVTSRFGIFVHFGALGAVGCFLSSIEAGMLWKGLRRPLALAFPVLLLLDFPPIHPVKLARLPDFPAKLNINCGIGALVSSRLDPYQRTISAYWLQAATRSTDCILLNPADLSQNESTLANLLNGDSPRRTRRLLECTGTSWLADDVSSPAPQFSRLCRDLGWTKEGNLCLGQRPLGPPQSLASCLATPQ